MLSRVIQAESTDDVVCCGNCRHSVDVLGMEQIVCQAHLAVFEATKEGGCGEFGLKVLPRPRSYPGDLTR
jgi:hypothetical protein